MAEFASLPLFTDAWLADTQHLGRAERGLYHDLLVLMWRSPQCRVPNDIQWIARKLKCTADEVAPLTDLIKEFCKKDRSWITQKRLMKEWQYVREKREKQVNAAKTRWKNEKEPCERTPDAYAKHTQARSVRTAPSPTPSSSLTPTPAQPSVHADEHAPEPRTVANAPAALDDRLKDEMIEPVLASVVAAAGLALMPAKRKAALAHVAGWLDGWPGCNIETDLLEPIRRHLAEKDGPTHSLARFDRVIMDRKARSAIQPAPPPSRPAAPNEGKAETAIRAALADELGDKVAAGWLDPCAFHLNDEALNVIAPSAFHAEHVSNNFGRVIAIHASRQAGRPLRANITIGGKR
jgi:uncharacterized protein YdaU (DUF1376 family)